MRIPRKLINLAKLSSTELRGVVWINGYIYEPFKINTGVRQGDGLSPILFNIAIEEALEKVAEMDLGIKTGTKINVLAFADDVAILAERFKNVDKSIYEGNRKNRTESK